MRKYKHRSYKYKNLTIAFLGIVFALFLSRIDVFHSFLLQLGRIGYVGAFLSGFFFVSTVTVASSALVLLILAERLSPIEISLIAGLGAVVGDLTIFHFVKDTLASEIHDIYNHIDKKKHLERLFHSKYFNWMLPVIGSIIIASPLPDELGISLIGLSKISMLRFVLMSYILNSFGIFLIVSASIVIKP